MRMVGGWCVESGKRVGSQPSESWEIGQHHTETHHGISPVFSSRKYFYGQIGVAGAARRPLPRSIS